MSTLYAPEGGKPRELPKAGLHAATLASITDLGDVPNFDKTGVDHKILFYYLLGEKDSSGQPKSIVESFKLSVNEKANLYKRLSQINGEAPTAKTNVLAVVGKNLQLMVTIEKGRQSGKENAKISAVVPGAVGQTTIVGPAVSSNVIDAFKGIKKVTAGVGAQRTAQPAYAGPIGDDDVPF